MKSQEKMIQFKEITLEDKEIIQSYTLGSWRANCELSFVNMFSWQFQYHTKYAIIDGFLITRFTSEDGSTIYTMPTGTGDLGFAIRQMIDDAKSLNVPFRMFGVCANLCKELMAIMPNAFEFSTNRMFSDYIYLRENLVNLKGKKLQSKRNFINRFIKNNPNFVYKKLTPELVPVCLDFEKQWLNSKATPAEINALNKERTAMTRALDNMYAIGLEGGVLFVDEKVVAFTYGGAINNSTFDVCIEKADANVDGAYTMINNLFAKQISEQYTYINREEDLEIPGLRQAKLSYQPELILEKFNVVLNDELV